MRAKSIIGYGLIGLLALAAVADAIRYLNPGPDNKIPVVETPLAGNSRRTMVMVYNAYGGLYPGVADMVNKAFFPDTYPCNLCFLAFGTFGKKPQWKQLLDSIPLAKNELHKDTFERQYSPANLPLPAILLSDGKQASVLVSAAEINKQKSLTELMDLLRKKLLKQPG